MRFDLQLFSYEQPFSPRTDSLKKNFDWIYAEIHNLLDNGIEHPKPVSATNLGLVAVVGADVGGGGGGGGLDQHFFLVQNESKYFCL